MKDKTGGPAFPCNLDGAEGEGMTLRDWFAGQALVGLCAVAAGEDTFDVFAKDAYAYADAMIKARDE